MNIKKNKLLKNLLLLFIIVLITTGQTCQNITLRSFLGKEPVNLELNDVGKIINSLIDWLLGGAAAVAIVFIMIGGVQYISSIGNPEAAQKAKNTLTYAIGGLILIISAYLIIKFIAGIFLAKPVFD